MSGFIWSWVGQGYRTARVSPASYAPMGTGSDLGCGGIFSTPNLIPYTVGCAQTITPATFPTPVSLHPERASAYRWVTARYTILQICPLVALLPGLNSRHPSPQEYPEMMVWL